jgi:excisionase family DNA binding protein
VAEFLRVPASWVYERTRRHGRDRLPHVKIGKYLRFRLSDLEAYLETLRRG